MIEGIRLDSGFALVTCIVLWAVTRSLVLMKRRKYTAILMRMELLINVFAVYCISVISITIFPIDIEWGITHRIVHSSVNIIPFADVIRGFLESNFSLAFKIKLLARNIIGNLLLLLPIGIFVPLIWIQVRSFWKAVIVGATVSLSLELLQYVLAYLGYGLGRATDIDDLILNTLGVMIGYFIFNKIVLRLNSVRYLGVNR